MDNNDWDPDLPVTIFCVIGIIALLFFVFIGIL